MPASTTRSGARTWWPPSPSRPGESLDEDAARARVKDELASYKVPRHIAVFADQTDLPWLDSGKVDRRRLTAILEERFQER